MANLRQVYNHPFGAFVATADLVACLPFDTVGSAMTRARAEWPLKYQHLFHHEHANGPLCLILENVRRIQPVVARGAQGLWDAQVEPTR